MSEQSFNSVQDDEISLKEIIDFLIESWKTIFSLGVLGLLSAIAFIFMVPSQYEAVVQIKMAQIDTGNNTTPLGVNVEEPNALISRMKLLSNFSDKEIQACDLKKFRYPKDVLVEDVIRLNQVKGVNSIVELKVRRESREKSLACAQAIFELIRDSQNAIMDPFIQEAKSLLHIYQVRLSNAQAFAAGDKISNELSAGIFLSTREEIRFFLEETVRLNAIITAGDIRKTKLIAPIYIAGNPVFPKVGMSLTIGLLIGLFLGITLAFSRKVILFYKNRKIERNIEKV